MQTIVNMPNERPYAKDTGDIVYRWHDAGSLVPDPRTLRTFKQYLYDRGYNDASMLKPRASSMEERYEWISTAEWCSYHAGYSDAIS